MKKDCVQYFPPISPKVRTPIYLKKGKPNFQLPHPDGGRRLFPVEAVLFYHNKVETVIDYEGEKISRISIFEDEDAQSETVKYNSKGHFNGTLLLHIK